MKFKIILSGILVMFFGSLLAQDKSIDYDKNWPNWRGPFANGISPDGNPPLAWSETKNVKWKVAIPGTGYSTPITWGDQIFLSTAIEIVDPKEGQNQEEAQQGGRRMRGKQTKNVHKFDVISLNRFTGKILWQKTVTEEVPQEGTHQAGSWASNSPVTDGENIYAYFGSRGLFCLDLKGNLKWQRDFGQMEKRNSFGEGSSPVLYEDKIIVLWDQEGQSFIIALDKKTGKDIWKVNRDETTTWSTPLVVEVNGKPQVITGATTLMRSYDLETGQQIWQSKGLFANVIPMPVAKENMVYLMSGHRGSALLAINLSEAKGDISDSETIVWRYNKDTPYTPSPLLMENNLYFFKSNSGILTCLDANDGTVKYSNQRLDGMGNLYTSPVGAGDRFYIIGGTGISYTVKHGSKFEILAKNQLDDKFHASPVIIGKNIYLRGFKYLYCIGSD